ncbi:cytochrome C [Ornithinibacillus gellani]|uniref:c-type cytochrome n=1 Tax=Ornithinibacillus gellani TaxID=2293253 RepID=UPI000F479DCC|nr:cytochrome C [Ornithinibacillus gellani]TQS74862.1 cytochrome C [Ornithinibacillus gellani]
MKMNSLIFAIAFILSFAGGYFLFSGGDSAGTVADSPEQQETSDAEKTEDGNKEETSQETVSSEAEALERNNCLSCHAVESIGVEGGTTGPDLSKAFQDVEGKHGKSLDEFLQEPTSAVMSTVIGDNPLSDEERTEIIKVLQKAAEQ